MKKVAAKTRKHTKTTAEEADVFAGLVTREAAKMHKAHGGDERNVPVWIADEIEACCQEIEVCSDAARSRDYTAIATTLERIEERLRAALDDGGSRHDGENQEAST